jgi:hypothetical protein
MELLLGAICDGCRRPWGAGDISFLGDFGTVRRHPFHMGSEPIGGRGMRTILGVFISVLLVAGCAGASGSAAPATAAPSASTPAASTPASVSPPSASAATVATPSPKGAFGGTVQYKLDGAPATTTVDAVADGATVSGTAVTTFREGTHTVKLGCATKSESGLVLAGTVEKTTVHGETPGYWSAVIVKNGTPPLIAIWLSGDPGDAKDCESWAASINPADFDAGNSSPIESGTLVPPA